jgi:hypothetical protein
MESENVLQNIIRWLSNFMISSIIHIECDMIKLFQSHMTSATHMISQKVNKWGFLFK